MDISKKLYIATIADDAMGMINAYQIGVEINEFCTAYNMDGEEFVKWDKVVREKLVCSKKRIFHAPFNELNPSAIDPQAVKLAHYRLNQAYRLAQSYGIGRMVVHSGYIPQIYFKNWFHDRSVEFWQEFMSDKPGNFSIMIENVLEDEPDTLKSIVEKISDPRVGVCLDIGHAHVMSDIPLERWVDVLAPLISHVHIHNNDKSHDRHWELGRGTIAMKPVLEQIVGEAPSATITIENIHCEPSLQWLVQNELLNI